MFLLLARTHWTLASGLVVPIVIAVLRWLQRVSYGTSGPFWLEQQTGGSFDGPVTIESMLTSMGGLHPRLERPAAAVKIGGLKAKPPKPPDFLPARVLQLFRSYDAPWCVAGGWAIDLFLGAVTREHQDVEIAVLLRDQQRLWQHIVGWQPRYCVPGSAELRPWGPGEWLHPPVHELHTRPPQSDIGELEILFDRSAGEEWIYRRDEHVRMQLSKAIRFNPAGIPYLAPEIVLLYKAKNPRERDEADFGAALPKLDNNARHWLSAALARTAPDHPWLKRLEL